MGSAGHRVQEMLAGLGRLLARRVVILGCVLGWSVGTVVIAVVLTPNAATVLMILATGMILVGLLRSHRQHLVLISEMRRQAEAEGTKASGVGRDVSEILDRLKLTALSLGRLSEDLAQSTQSVRQALVREAENTYRQLEAMQNLYGLIPTSGRMPPMRGSGMSPERVLALVELLRVERPGLVVECGSGVSTVWCALAIRQFGTDTRIVALDHDPTSAANTRGLLAAYGVADLVDIRDVPLEQVEIAGQLRSWYAAAGWADLAQIGLLHIGSCLVDDHDCRVALALLRERLADDVVVLLDDHAELDEDERHGWPVVKSAISAEGNTVTLRPGPTAAA